MKSFLKTAAFPPKAIRFVYFVVISCNLFDSFVPCSGLTGENLVDRKCPELTSWYSGPTLLECIGIPSLEALLLMTANRHFLSSHQAYLKTLSIVYIRYL